MDIDATTSPDAIPMLCRRAENPDTFAREWAKGL